MSIMLPNLNRLSDHIFVLRILEDTTPLMKPGSHVDDYDFEPRKRYVSRAGYYVGQLLNQTERIDQAGILVNSYPLIRAWRKRYGRFEYFQYHMEHYYIALSGLMDRLLLLVNHLYEMELPVNNVRFKNVISTLETRNQPQLVVKMKSLQESTRNIKLSKNRYTHSNRFWEKKLWHIGVLEFAIKNEIIKDDKHLLKEDLVFDTKLYRLEKMKLIADNEEAVLQMMQLIYDEFYKQYLLKLEDLPPSVNN